jgi:Zn-finger nucleic acid-binding protein
MKCPVCNVDLLMGERLSISIDYCPQCRGIWLEKGKLDQLLAGGGMGQQPQRSSGSGGVIESMLGKYSGNDHDHHDHDHYEKKHKKRSFLDDLF